MGTGEGCQGLCRGMWRGLSRFLWLLSVLVGWLSGGLSGCLPTARMVWEAILVVVVVVDCCEYLNAGSFGGICQR